MSAQDTARLRELDVALRRFFRARVDAETSEDLTQEVLLRMHERREQLRADERLEAWAFRIARNALIDHRRRREPSAGSPLPELPAPPLEPHDPTEQLLGTWLRQRIAELPDSYRQALELTELQGRSQREAAAMLGLPYSTLKSRVQRGRDRLEAELLRCCAVELDARGRVQDFEPRACTTCACEP